MVTARKRQHNIWHRELAEYWKQRPITYCEIRLPGCFGTYGLAPAHSRKRREIETKEQYFEVIAACTFCHNFLDQQMSHEQMERTVKEVIANRELTFRRYFSDDIEEEFTKSRSGDGQ